MGIVAKSTVNCTSIYVCVHVVSVINNNINSYKYVVITSKKLQKI